MSQALVLFTANASNFCVFFVHMFRYLMSAVFVFHAVNGSKPAHLWWR
jgi:hypothetical protein